MPHKMVKYWATRTAFMDRIVGQLVGARPVVTWSKDMEDAWVDSTHRAKDP